MKFPVLFIYPEKIKDAPPFTAMCDTVPRIGDTVVYDGFSLKVSSVKHVFHVHVDESVPEQNIQVRLEIRDLEIRVKEC